MPLVGEKDLFGDVITDDMALKSMRQLSKNIDGYVKRLGGNNIFLL